MSDILMYISLLFTLTQIYIYIRTRTHRCLVSVYLNIQTHLSFARHHQSGTCSPGAIRLPCFSRYGVVVARFPLQDPTSDPRPLHVAYPPSSLTPLSLSLSLTHTEHV